ncbi:hypothetical protein Aduo_000270 [Ancylostoma duodenale]
MSNIDVLNVGGEKFATTRETLKSSVSGENTFFANLDDSKREICIDRDPKVFIYILNYLRDGKLAIPQDQSARTRISQEAEVCSSKKGLCRCLLRYSIFSLEKLQYFCMDKLATMIDFAKTGRPVVIEAIRWDPAYYG